MRRLGGGRGPRGEGDDAEGGGLDAVGLERLPELGVHPRRGHRLGRPAAADSHRFLNVNWIV